jgi:hypothetical protein
MRTVLALLAIIMVACLRSASAWACGDIASCDLRKYMTSTEFEAFRKTLAAKRRPMQARAQVAQLPSSRPPIPDWPVVGGFEPRRFPIDRPRGVEPLRPSSALQLFLRKDFADVSLFSKPISTADAAGAEFSYSRDNIIRDSTFTGTGLVALAYRYNSEDRFDPFVGWTIAPYVSFNRELHSRKIDDNVDTKAFGISGETGYQNPLFVGADYFRGRLAAVSDDIRLSTNVSGTFEWIPTYAWVGGTLPGTYVNFSFRPEAKVQYDSTTESGKTLIFSGRREALRAGPEAHLLLKFYGPPGPVYDGLRQFSANVTYHWWTEVYSGRRESWLDSSLTYNIDPDGHIGIKLSYKRGQDEETGAKMDLYKVTLAAKLCADLFSRTTC